MAPHPIPSPTSEGITEITDVPLYWCRYGRRGAVPLLVLHGGPGAHHEYLLPQMLALADLGGGHELILYDQRGGGRSRTDAREPITWRTQVADAGSVVEELGVSPLTIVGYSWGGLLAALYAAESVRARTVVAPTRLILIDPAPINRHYRAQFEQEFARRQASADVTRLRQELASSNLRDRDPEGYRQRNFELSVAGYFAHPESAKDLTPFRVNARVQQAVWDSLGDFDLTRDGTFSAIDVPTLIVHGRQDSIPLASSEQAAHAIGSHAQLVVIEDCGHVPYVEQPTQLFRAIGDFLQATAPRS